jgi:NAD(P)H-dependent FMN reductase
MSDSKLKIQVIVGTTRQGRFADKPVGWLVERLKQSPRLDIELVDLRDVALPMFDQPMSPARVTTGDYGNPAVNAWGKKVAEADGYVLVAAEYNHGYTAVLKNALDSIFREWNRKPVAFMGYGATGGARAVEQLRQVAVELEMAPIRRALHVPLEVMMATMKEPLPLKPELFASLEKNAQLMVDDLIWWADALKKARQP